MFIGIDVNLIFACEVWNVCRVKRCCVIHVEIAVSDETKIESFDKC